MVGNKSKYQANKKKSLPIYGIGCTQKSRTPITSHASTALSRSHYLEHLFSIKNLLSAYPLTMRLAKLSPWTEVWPPPTLQSYQQHMQWQGDGNGEFLQPFPFLPFFLLHTYHLIMGSAKT